MAFRNEAQLRKLWKDATPGNAYFVEPSIGSTFGLPDVFSLNDGVMIGSELKKGTVSGGRLRFRVRNSQRKTIPQLVGDGAVISVAVAEVGTGIVHVIDADLLPGWEVLSGAVDLELVKAAAMRQNHLAEGAESGLKSYEWGYVNGRPVNWVFYGKSMEKSLKSLKFKAFSFP